MPVTDRPAIFTPRPRPSGAHPDSQFLQLRCADCRHLFEAEIPTRVPYPVAIAAVTAITCPACRGGHVLSGQYRSLEEDAAFPRGDTLDRRIALWLDNGERGASSEAIHERMSGLAQAHRDHPRDPLDLNGCLLLLARIPEWSGRMGEMAAVSPAWARLAPRWGELVEAYRREEDAFRVRGAPAPRTCAILSEIRDA